MIPNSALERLFSSPRTSGPAMLLIRPDCMLFSSLSLCCSTSFCTRPGLSIFSTNSYTNKLMANLYLYRTHQNIQVDRYLSELSSFPTKDGRTPNSHVVFLTPLALPGTLHLWFFLYLFPNFYSLPSFLVVYCFHWLMI